MDLLAYMLASGGDDNSLKLWFWLIVGVIFLIKKAIELLKPDEKDEEPSVPDTENHHEKRVREVIAEMRRATPQPQQTQPAAPARAPRPSAPPVELPSPAVARKPQRGNDTACLPLFRRLHNPRKQPGRRRKMYWNAT